MSENVIEIGKTVTAFGALYAALSVFVGIGWVLTEIGEAHGEGVGIAAAIGLSVAVTVAGAIVWALGERRGDGA